jgi:dihydroorotase
MLKAVLPYSAADFGRAIIMPNLKPPITTAAAARRYRDEILAARPPSSNFEPLMTCYLTDDLSPNELVAGFDQGVFIAAKLYPAGATTNSDDGVSDVRKLYPILESMQDRGMPLLMHGEVVDPEVDIFDREKVFIERVLAPLRTEFPALKMVMEHITTAEAVDYVSDQGETLAATITPHHLMINRNAIFKRGIRPHMYCLPVAKREHHRLALRQAATSGSSKFFLGTDSAPHLASLKEHACGCAGIFNSPNTLACLAQVFDEESALDQLEAFTSLNGPAFYRLPANSEHIYLERAEAHYPKQVEIPEINGAVRVFEPPQPLTWRVKRDV